MATSIRASLNRMKTEVVTPENQDRALGVQDVASVVTDMADHAATASTVVAAFGGQVSNVIGALGSAGTTVMGAVGSAAAVVELGLSIKERREAKRDIKTYQEQASDPVVLNLLQQRTHATAMLDHGRTEMAHLQLERAALEQQLARHEATNSADVGGLREIEAKIAAKDQQIGKIEVAVQKADERINEINATPEMKELHVIESKAALASAMLKRSGDFRIDGAETALKGASTLLDVGQGAVGIAAGAAGGASAAVTAVPIVGGAVSIATGAGQSVVSAASLIHNAYRAHKEGVRERKARDAREGIEDPELNAAIKRVQNKAGRNKLERGVMAIRDSAGVIAGASAAVAGVAVVTTTALAAASAPGFGVGGLPSLAIAGGSAALAVGAGAVSAAAAGGAQLMKVGRHLQSVWHKNDAIRCNEAMDDLKRLGLMKLPCDEQGRPVPLPKGMLSPGKAAALERVQKLAIKKGYLTPEEALDPAKLGEFAKVRLITRDTRFAVDTLSNRLLAECDVAIQHRGGNGIVTSDLPNSPAVNAARKLGIKDSEIVGMVNAAHDERTRLVAKQTIAQKTGLRSGTDAEVKRAPFVVKRK